VISQLVTADRPHVFDHQANVIQAGGVERNRLSDAREADISHIPVSQGVFRVNLVPDIREPVVMAKQDDVQISQDAIFTCIPQLKTTIREHPEIVRDVVQTVAYLMFKESNLIRHNSHPLDVVINYNTGREI
jgi:hypothetical protein